MKNVTFSLFENSIPKKLPKIPSFNEKENSTYYKTFYSKNSVSNKTTGINYFSNAYKKNSAKSVTSILKNNKPLSSYAKYASNVNMNKRKLTSLIKHKKNNNGLNFSSIETDDTIFALSEIKSIDHKINKRINKRSVWKEKPRNIYDICASRNHKDIEDVKIGVRLYGRGANTFDLRSEIDKKKYFPIEKVDVINEAKNIINIMKCNKLKEEKAYENFADKNRTDLQTFIKQNRDICIKNILINLLKNESNKIKTKEKEIIKALYDSNKGFDKDYNAFDEFMLMKKLQFKESDLKLDEAIKYNKMLMEKIRKLNSELHGHEDEIEKMIRGITLYKTYSDFIHKLLGKEKFDFDIKNLNTNLMNKHKDLEQILQSIFDYFDFLLEDDAEIPVDTQEINNQELLTTLFVSLENNIIKKMKERDIINKDRYKQKTEYEKEILQMQKKILADEIQYQNLLQEFEDEKKRGIPSDNYKNNIDIGSLIYEIFEELDSSILKGPKKTLDNLIKNCFDLIHKMEDDINVLFGEMEKIQGDEKKPDELFKKILEKIKLEIKIKKHREGKEFLKKLEEQKNLKYLQRMNRYKIHGPIIYPPPWVLKKKKEKYEQENKNVDNDEDIIYY